MIIDKVLDRAGNHEILLLEPQAFSSHGIIIGIKDLGNVFCFYLLFHRAVEIPPVEVLKIKALCGFCLPQSQEYTVWNPVTYYGYIIGNPLYFHARMPLDPIRPVWVCVAFGMAAKINTLGYLGPVKFPGFPK